MSRLGRMPIEIPSGVTVTIEDGVVDVKGPKGELKYTKRPEIDVKLDGNIITTSILKNTRDSVAYWGLTRATLANMVVGVTKGYEKHLELIGVGYRVKQNGQDGVIMNLGFSHQVDFKAPEGVLLEVGENQTITVKGFDKQLVGLTAARIRKIRKPEPYKGKGIKYADEVIRRKVGKAAKTAK